jgi:solute carrier family 25 (adenine nucleotide translocator) protein 4/5/6/31
MNFAFKDKIKQIAIFKTKKNEKYILILIKNIFSGALAGIASLPLVYSLDYTRTRLSNDIISGGNREFKGLIDVYIKTWKAEGILGLHRGFCLSCITVFIYRGIYFGLYDSAKPFVINTKKFAFIQSFLLGFIITVIAGLITYPFDTVRRRMMMRVASTEQYKGSMDCMKRILNNEGKKALFRGAGINILRGIAGAGALAFFDKFIQIYTGKKNRLVWMIN